MIKIKRIYEESTSEDGYRVLVDRLWPRGLTREKAHVDEWLKEAGPSNELRKWFHEHPDRWEEFRTRYTEELRTKTELLKKIASRAHKGRVTLLYSRRDEQHNQAVVIKEFMDGNLPKSAG